MNIVILSGGSGNTALVNGLIKHGKVDDITIITNMYDNGKSTGICRAVTDTLGVSDVRKNHFKVYKAKYANNLNDNLVEFYSNRYDLGNNPASFCTEKLTSWGLGDLVQYSDSFFCNANAHKFEYKDFSIANIVYAQMYKEIGYAATNKYFTELLGLNNFVKINSYDNAYIYAETVSGKNIGGEENIVEYKNADDPIVKLIYTDKNGKKMSEFLNVESLEAIMDADLIIISTGTFWSSIYPTLEYGDFYRWLNISKAKKLWFMNTEEDKDAYGISSNMFIEYMENLGVDLSNFTIVENLDAIESLREESNKHSITYKHLGNINGKNDPDCLYSVIAPYYEQI